MAGLPGFEPGMAASKAAALPLGDRPAGSFFNYLKYGAEGDLNSHLAAPEPKSGASTNSATSASIPKCS